MPEIINIEIIEKHATALGAPVIVCGNAGYSIQFSFDSEWEGLDSKIARFVYVSSGMTQCKEVEFTGDTVEVPALINTREVMVGVYTDTLCTSTPALVPCELSIRCLAAESAANSGGTGGGGVVGGTVKTARIADVTLPASEWVYVEEYRYTQVVNIEGVTENSQVDLTPSAEQLIIFRNKDLTFVAENEDGVVTVSAIGQKPTNDYVIQATITEVMV